MKEIEVYLIRHGESTSNVHFKILLESITNFLLFKNYSFSNFFLFLISLFYLTFYYEKNSKLSELGKKQVYYLFLLLISLIIIYNNIIYKLGF